VKIIKPQIILLALLLFFLTISSLCWLWVSSPVCQNNCTPKIFVVSRGESFSSIANRLEKENIIHSAAVFHLLALKEGIINKVQAGDFRLNPQMSPLEIALELTHGTLDSWVTILEGWRREEIAQKLGESGLANFDAEVFLKNTQKLEGQLFPDTYLIPKTATSDQIIQILTKNFQKKAGQVDSETLILASIIEREIRGKQDRKIVAGIFLKRLKNDWPLQADATVQYAVASAKCKLLNANCTDWWPHNLTKTDLAIKSAYNTYNNRGLPPFPICNPSLSAIQAVLEPVETEFWFYLSDSSGNTHFAKTDLEHAENIRKYLLNE
jgi:UPF0755 protein